MPVPYAELTKRVETLEKLVRDHFDEKNNWNSEVRGWIGKRIHIRLIDGSETEGVLRWMDRYTLCVDLGKVAPQGSTIVHKGAIAMLSLFSLSDKLK